MKHLCDRCCNARDGAPDILLVACDKGIQVRGPDGEILQCNKFDELPEVQLNLPKRDYKKINDDGKRLLGTGTGYIAYSIEGESIMNGEFEVKEKPPTGICPYFVAGGYRIKDLAKAIERYAENPKWNLSTMRRWATEIIAQCDLIEKMEEST